MDPNVQFAVAALAVAVAFAIVCHVSQRAKAAQAATQHRAWRLAELARLTLQRDDLVSWTGFKDADLAAKIVPEISDIRFDIGRLSKMEFDSPERKAEEAARLAAQRAITDAAYNALPLQEKIALKRRWLAKHEADLAAYGWLRQNNEPVIARLKADITSLEAETEAAR
jgi:hypothetical protein